MGQLKLLGYFVETLFDFVIVLEIEYCLFYEFLSYLHLYKKRHFSFKSFTSRKSYHILGLLKFKQKISFFSETRILFSLSLKL